MVRTLRSGRMGRPLVQSPATAAPSFASLFPSFAVRSPQQGSGGCMARGEQRQRSTLFFGRLSGFPFPFLVPPATEERSGCPFPGSFFEETALSTGWD